MRIQFEVDGEPVEFHRSWFTGRAELRLRGEVVPLQCALDPTTHFSLTLTQIWKHWIGEHEVVIEKVRPLVLAGFRAHAYQVVVDGVVVAQETGY
jgi:hypothetical protein